MMKMIMMFTIMTMITPKIQAATVIETYNDVMIVETYDDVMIVETNDGNEWKYAFDKTTKAETYAETALPINDTVVVLC